jgi:DNA-binding transcriptional MocR family regulator
MKGMIGPRRACGKLGVADLRRPRAEAPRSAQSSPRKIRQLLHSELDPGRAREVINEMRRHPAHLTRSIDKYFPSGTRVSRPAGGFVLWLEFPAAVKARELFRSALDEGICFAPGDVFSASGRFSNCLRVSCGHSWDARIERGVARLGALAAEALAKSRK